MSLLSRMLSSIISFILLLCCQQHRNLPYPQLQDYTIIGQKTMRSTNFFVEVWNSWIMCDHVKDLYKWTTTAWHVSANTNCKTLTIACCDMQSDDAHAHTYFWQNLNAIMLENGVLKVNFKELHGGQCIDKLDSVRKVLYRWWSDCPSSGHKHRWFLSIHTPM